MNKSYAELIEHENKSMDYTIYAVVQREWDDEEEVIGDAELFISGVSEVARQTVKDALVSAKRLSGSSDRPWRNRTLLPPSKWNFETQMYYEHEECETVTFDDLIMEANGERRMTLQVPIDLYTDLAVLAEKANRPFNEYCVSVLTSHALLGRDAAELSHRDAMRALYQIYGDDKDSIIDGWVRLHEMRLVRIKKNPRGNPPDVYSQLLYQDAMSKKWLSDAVAEPIVLAVRAAMEGNG